MFQNHSNNDQNTTKHLHSTTHVERNAVVIGVVIYEAYKPHETHTA